MPCCFFPGGKLGGASPSVRVSSRFRPLQESCQLGGDGGGGWDLESYPYFLLSRALKSSVFPLFACSFAHSFVHTLHAGTV